MQRPRTYRRLWLPLADRKAHRPRTCIPLRPPYPCPKRGPLLPPHHCGAFGALNGLLQNTGEDATQAHLHPHRIGLGEERNSGQRRFQPMHRLPDVQGRQSPRSQTRPVSDRYGLRMPRSERVFSSSRVPTGVGVRYSSSVCTCSSRAPMVRRGWAKRAVQRSVAGVRVAWG